jgi:hypothetical protein
LPLPLFELIGVGCQRLAKHFDEMTGRERAQPSGPRSGSARPRPYRTRCPKCRARVVTEELHSGGCYVCGWRPPERDGRDALRSMDGTEEAEASDPG